MKKNWLHYKALKSAIILSASLPKVVFAQTEVTNPLQAEDVTSLLEDVVGVIATLSVPVIAIMIIYAGFLFVTAGGDESQIEDAKSTAAYTTIGATIILGAELIVRVLQNTAGSLGIDGLS